MFKEPDYKSINAPRHILQKIEKGSYLYQKGNLRFASPDEVALEFAKYFIPLFVAALFVVYYLPPAIATVLAITLFIIYILIFYYFGWIKEFVAWYIFDPFNQLLSVITREKQQWVDIDIPYEDIQEISWVGTKNGKAIIIAPPFKLPTYRMSIKQQLNVTEIWEELARTHAPMTNWKFILQCPIDGSTFGHHLGTALCPDHPNSILLPVDYVSEINSTELHPQDLDRI